MRMNKKNITKYILWIVIFCVGICIGKLLNWGYFTLSKEVSIIDAITLFVTVGCAIFIAKVLEKEVQDDRIEKDLFLSQASQLEFFLGEIEKNIESPDCLYSNIVNFYSSANKTRNKFFKRIDAHNIRLSKSQTLNEIKKELENYFKSLKPLLTDTPVIQTDLPDIVVESGKIKYSESRLTEIRNELTNIYDCLFAIKIIVNRC